MKPIQLNRIPVFRVLVTLTLVAITFELGGMWSELKGLRHEQVKNAIYSTRPDIVARLRSTPRGELRLRQLSGQIAVVAGSDGPLSVKIEDTEFEPIYVQAAETIPVEIQR